MAMLPSAEAAEAVCMETDHNDCESPDSDHVEERIQTVTILQKSLSQRAEAQELHPWRHERRADDMELPRPPHRHGSMCEDGSDGIPLKRLCSR